MALKLIKRKEDKCKCGCEDFVAKANGWVCTDCNLYRPNAFENLQEALGRLVKYVKETK